MSVPSIPKDQFLAIKQLWQTKLALEEKVKSLEAICNINGNLKSILENLTKEFRAIPGSSISDTTGGSTVVDPATINHELLGGLLGGAVNDHYHLTAAELAALHPAVTVVDTASIDLTISGQTLSGAVLPAGVDHNSLANLTTGDPHTQYAENSGSITQITTRNHSDLQNKNDETDVKHLTDAQLAALHAAVTIADSTSVDLSLTGQQISAAVLPAGVDHNSLANLTTGDPHTQYTENSGNITQITTRNHNDLQNHNAGADLQHMTAAQISALHARQHAIDSTADHTSDITAGKGLIANVNGLPAGSAHVTETATGVGLSVANPKTKLDIDGSIRLSSGNVMGSSFDTTLERLRNTIKFYGTNGDMVFETFYPGTSSYRFFTGGRAGVGELHELLTLYKTNKVGVGVPIPTEKLDVAGNINISTGSVIKRNTVDVSTGWDSAATKAHDRSHAITSSSDHTSTATAGKILKADANGLPVDSIITETSGLISVAGNIESTGAYDNKIIVKNSTTPATGASTSIELEDVGSTPNKHRIWLRSLINTTYLEHKNNGSTDIGRFAVISNNGPGSLWIANNAASPALNDSMGALTFGTAGGTLSHLLLALHGDYATGKTGGGQLLLYQRDSTDTIRQNVTFDGLNRRVGINDAAPGEALDVTGNINATGVLKIDDVQVIKERQAAIADASAGTEIATINSILAALRAHGLIAT